ncbi:restriction endonuclease subunit S [Vibrio campbellii]|uniref:restriction endonuclease subunit S n=1 Tax=Vibrio campbellii TaxID=680 RepID=UPI00210E6D44|nr:restriction endonuclease subunit S [Vibrio campbellii]UTZ37998.1 restriction endonuclease subunit S [Vibrio campbellii]
MVPNGWVKTTFGKITKIGNGQVDPKVEPYSSMTHIGPENVVSNTGQITNLKSCSALGLISGKYEFDENSIVYSKIRPNLNKVCRPDFKGVCSADMYPIWSEDNLDINYLYHYMLGPYFNRIAIAMSMRTGMPKINRSDLNSLSIVLPPLPEQRKIAQILSTWDRGIATTEKLIDASKQQKKALMQQLLTGKKRLVDPETGKAFEGEWKFSQFNELYKVANNKATQVKSGEYLESGRTPIVDQGKSIVGGYTNNEITYKDLPVIVFGDHTRIVKWVDFEFAQGADGTQVLKSHKSMDDKFAYYVLLNTDIPNLGYSRHMRELKERDFKYPISKVEQQKIASVLTAADKEIELLEAKLSHFKQEKKALMQQLLTGKRRVKVPETEAA